MTLKRTIFSIASGALMFAPLAGSVHAGTVNCSSTKTTVVTSVSSNTTVAYQTVFSSNTTGGNLNAGNIGGSGISTGHARNRTWMGVTGNTNSTLIGLPGGGTTNNCMVIGN